MSDENFKLTREHLYWAWKMGPKLEAIRIQREMELRKQNPFWPFKYDDYMIDILKKWAKAEDKEIEIKSTDNSEPSSQDSHDI